MYTKDNMKDALMKLTDEAVSKVQAFFESPEGKSFVAETKAADAGDVGTFKVIITTEDVDRVGEMIKADAWELERYMLNPIVLWAHNYGELPIGVTETLTLVDGNKLQAEGKFASHQKAQEVRALYDAGIMRATSVGFIPKEMEGNIITKAELLEFSFVPVPCNPYALAVLEKTGMQADTLMTKGFLTKAEGDAPAPAEGDVCELEDGSEGAMAMEEGTLVCKPKPVQEDAIVEPKAVEEIETKEGRVLSKANVAKVEAAVESAKSLIATLEELLQANAGSGANAAEPEGTKGTDDDAFLAIRKAMQEVAGVVTDALAVAKKDAHARGIKTR